MDRALVYHYGRGTKNILLYYIYCDFNCSSEVLPITNFFVMIVFVPCEGISFTRPRVHMGSNAN